MIERPVVEQFYYILETFPILWLYQLCHRRTLVLVLPEGQQPAQSPRTESKQELYKKAICYLLLIQLSRRAIVKKAVNDAIRAIMMYQYVIDHGR